MEKALLQMIAEVNRKRSAFEVECNMLRELLKPWPKEKKESSKIVSENSSQKELDKKEDNLSKEEQEALLTVEKLLQKAHITRQAKAKHKTKAEKKDVCAIEEEAMNDGTHHAALQSSCVATATKTFNTNVSQHNTKYVLNEDTDFIPIHAEVKKTSHSVGSTKGNKNSVHSQASQLLDKNLTIKNKSVITSSQSQRPSSQTRSSARPGSGKNRYVPVHMSAPFKTENVKMPTRRTNQAQSFSKHSSTKPRPGSGLSCSSYKALPAIKHSSTTNSYGRDKAKFLEKTTAPTDEASRLPIPDPNTRGNVFNMDTRACDHLGGTEAYVNEDLISSSLEVQDSTQRSSQVPCSVTEGQNRLNSPSALTESEVNPEMELFTLRRNGSGLKIPGKLAKLVSVNNSLREQCSTARLLKRVSPSDSGQQFVERLQGEWEISEELWTYIRAITCLRAHKSLLEMLQELDLPRLTAQSSYQVLYRAKRTLEFVLSMFSSLQEESDYLSQVQFRDVHVEANQESDLTAAGSSDLHAGFKNKNAEQHLRGCREWTQLKFTEDYLNIQMQLLDLVKSEWWQALSTDTGDPSVLQALYSLLSSGGQFLPTFVTNE